MQQAKLVATDRDIADGFGWSVATAITPGSRPRMMMQRAVDPALAGSAYIFARSGARGPSKPN
ncbi:MAG: hypothetical protein IPO05_04715 [Flavobacteriales bacterium]|nr:hypothetical protein [Flavobacteriales bacterium]